MEMKTNEMGTMTWEDFRTLNMFLHFHRWEEARRFCASFKTTIEGALKQYMEQVASDHRDSLNIRRKENVLSDKKLCERISSMAIQGNAQGHMGKMVEFMHAEKITLETVIYCCSRENPTPPGHIPAGRVLGIAMGINKLLRKMSEEHPDDILWVYLRGE